MRLVRSAIIAVWSLWLVLLSPTLAALGLGLAIRATRLDRTLTPLGWIVAAPALYVVWLLGFLAISAVEVRLRFGGRKKPAFGSVANVKMSYLHMVITICYAKGYIVRSLPLTSVFLAVPILRTLVLRSYAPQALVGHDVLMAGYIYDPDLTEIADRVVLGGDCVLCSHAMSIGRDGSSCFVSAPIRIERGAVVGGQVRINMGVTIGPGAVVEPCSNVVPFTTIGPGEIWAGNPAVLVRRRESAGSSGSAEPASTPIREAIPSAREAARRLVASTLASRDDPVVPEAGWDSIEQLAIAAALEGAHGRRVPPDRIFALRDLDDVARYLDPDAADQARTAREAPTEPEALPGNPELLPTLDHDLVTRRLATRPPASGRPLRVVVASSFTAEPLATALRLWAGAFGIVAEIEFAPFGQVQQTLRDPESLFRRNPGGMNVVLIRPEDLPGEPRAMADELDSLADALSRLAAETPASTLVVGTIPPPVSSHVRLDRTALDLARAEWRRRLAAIDGLEVLDVAAIVETLGVADAADPALEAVARAPYSASAYREIGIGLARLTRRRRRPRAKVLALDCDGVLWGGVVAEDGPDGIALGPDGPGRAFAMFQQAVLDLKRRGVLLALVSRNEEADVLQVLDDHPGSVLRRGDLAAWRINWEPKPEGLRQLARELNLGLDAFVFLDDDPAQRLRVEAELPEVTVLPLPDDPSRFAELLGRLWIFDDGPATSEDARRTEMIRQEQTRQALRHDAPDLDGYLRGLDLVVSIRDARPRDLARAAQLTQKTNQLHLALRRRTIEDFRGLGPEHRVVVVSARDRFGDYGTIGLAILRVEPEDASVVEIDTFLLSCRALGRGIEQAVLHVLAGLAESLGARRLRVPYVEGPRNRPALDLFEAQGFTRAAGPAFEADLPTAAPWPDHLTLEIDLDDPGAPVRPDHVASPAPQVAALGADPV